MSSYSIRGSGGGCFLAGTKIRMADYTEKSIESIEAGDLVLAFDDRGTLHRSVVLRTNTHKNLEVYKYTLWGGSSLYATPNHWVLTNQNYFTPIGSMNESLTLVNTEGLLVPILHYEHVGTATVYNFIVEEYHTYIANNIRVHNGGDDKGGSTPVNVSDNLKSTSYAKILDLIGEGEVEGLVTGDAKSIYINNVPLMNTDGSYNFSDFEYTFKTGTQTQEYIPGFDFTEEEVSGPGEVRSVLPPKYSGTIVDDEVDRVRVTIGIPALYEYATNGDSLGSIVAYKVGLVRNSTDLGVVIDKVVEGKTTSKFQLSHTIQLPRLLPSDTFKVYVTKVTEDSTDARIQNTLTFDSYTLIKDVKLRYPNSVVCGIKIASAQFSAIPSRGYHLKLLKVKIPSNYDPDTRVYTGIWDGTFSTPQWTNNPAWCFYDLVTNERYGLGEYVPAEFIDKWSLYNIAKYCDELVPDGTGGMEPRFTLNIYIQTREEAIKVLSDLVGVFRGMVYWSAGSISVAQDSDSSTPLLQFSNSNVVNGSFEYSGASRKVIHTAALVTWNDPTDLYTQKIEYIEDRESISRYGYNPTELVAVGCTSRGQAHRVGKWLLYTERVENSIVTFKAGLESSYCRPGDIIKVSDELKIGDRVSGRLVSIGSSTGITLDRPVTLVSGRTYSIRFIAKVSLTNEFTGLSEEKLQTVTRQVTSTNISSNTISIDDTTGLYVGTVWTLTDSLYSELLYRLVSITETDDIGVYQLTGMLHNPSKFDFIENNLVLEERVYSGISAKPGTIDTSSLNYFDDIYIRSDGSIGNFLEVSFTTPSNTAKYDIYYKAKNSSWVKAFSNYVNPNFKLYDLVEGYYYTIKIVPSNIVGIKGNELLVENIYISGKSKPPQDVTNFTIGSDLTLNWTKVTDIDLEGYILKFHYGRNFNWDTAVPIYTGIITESPYKVNSLPNGLLTILIKAIDTSGNESTNAAVILKDIVGNRLDNVVETIETNLATYTILEGSYNSGQILGDTLTSSSFYKSNNDSDPFFSEASTDSFYSGNTYGSISIISEEVLINNYTNSACTINTDLIGINSTIEYRLASAGLFITSQGSDSFYSSIGAEPFYGEAGLWQPFIGKVYLEAGLYQFKLTTEGSSTPTSVSQIDIIIDTPDIVEYFEDLIVPSTGLFIPLVNTYNSIKSIVVTLQSGLTSAATVVVDKSSPLAPMIFVKDSTGNNISDAIVDITVKGY